MTPRLLPSFASLLLAALLFPAGLSSASSINHLVTEPPSFPKDEFPARGVNGSQLNHRVKRLPPRTPPYREAEPNYQIVNCKKSEGQCQEYCNFMETQVGYCSKKKEACCLHPF